MYFQTLLFTFNLTLFYQFQAQNLSILCQSTQTRGWRPVTQVQAWPCRAGATPPSTTGAGWWTPTPPWTTSRTSRSPSPRLGSYLRRPCSARRHRPCRPRRPWRLTRSPMVTWLWTIRSSIQTLRLMVKTTMVMTKLVVMFSQTLPLGLSCQVSNCFLAFFSLLNLVFLAFYAILPTFFSQFLATFGNGYQILNQPSWWSCSASLGLSC